MPTFFAFEPRSRRVILVISLISITVADDATTWARLGFVVAGSAVGLGAVSFVCADSAQAGERGITDWMFHDPEGVLPVSIDGLATRTGDKSVALRAPEHPNGVTGIDHLVVSTPDLERTVRALEDLGLPCRRRRDAGSYGSSTMRQAFFWLGPANDRVLLEVVGEATPDPAKAHEPARFFGIAFVCADLDATVSFFGDLVKAPIDAVQRGRRITSVSSKAGSTVAIALMSPHQSQS